MRIRNIKMKFLYAFALILSVNVLNAQNSTTGTVAPLVNEKDTMPPVRFFTVSDSALFTASMLDTAKPTVLFYFSTTCPYCEAMLKEFFESPNKLKDVNVLLVSGHKRGSIKQLLSPYDAVKTPFRILKDDEYNMHRQFNYSGVPMLRIYDKNKKLVFRHEGKMTLANLLKTI